MGDMPEIKQLLTLANEIMADTDEDSIAVEKIEKFTSLFNEWLEWVQENQPKGQAPSFTAEEGAELLALHEQVLLRAEELQHSTRKDLRNLRSRAKGIMAYAGKLPDSISIGKKNKG